MASRTSIPVSRSGGGGQFGQRVYHDGACDVSVVGLFKILKRDKLRWEEYMTC